MMHEKNNRILVFSFFRLFITVVSCTLIGPLIPIISKDLNVGLDYIGSVLSLSVFGLFITALTTGNLIEVFGYKRIIFLGSLLNIFGCLGLYFSYYYTIFLIAYFLLQIGTGIITFSIFSLVGNYYSGKKTSSLIKAVIGNTLALVVSPLLASAVLTMGLSWRFFYIYILAAQIILLIWLISLKIPKSIKVKRDLKSLFSINKKISSNPNFILFCIIVFIHAAVMNTFFTWFTTYFSNLNINLNISSLFLACYGLSVLIGMLIKNKIIKHIEEKRMLLFGVIISFIALAGAFFTGDLILKNILIFLFGVSVAGNFTITYSIGTGIYPEYTNFTSGFLIASANLGVMTFQYLGGYLSEHFSKNSVLYMDIILLFMLFVTVLILNTGKKFSSIHNDILRKRL